MERKKTDQKPPRWRKLGGGSMRIPGKIIKPGQIFRAWSEEIPKGFRDLVQPVDGQSTPSPTQTEQEEIAKMESTEPTYEKRPKGGGWYDIYQVDTGKKMNEKSVREDEADELLEQLNLEEA